ncbi:dicarboxylate/amino acid:cation symporter [Kroppenstedtia eburnea]|uniref:Na+/H+-dicarboxylate symporter n=1 Tax=Kroppenstedtia eburnea TaxID=714067 RepID=A0A1N7NHH6_9BACL|nr:dicarboxylate/amino acid:cation symporter [Kroppenstedtia eburnea]QKI80940.1 dicarboxylate/amino acid:cation symporter [Kroppenstedtia eburnea]SIS97757.1 Na+/H+-dicarboxylate symporter [Kroppenstedtia eburnea]
MKITTKTFLGIILGLVVGLVLNQFYPEAFKVLNTWLFAPIGDLFIRAIKMIVVPLVFFSIVMGAAGIGNPKKLGRIGGKTVFLYLITTAIAITIALLLANAIGPGEGVHVAKPEKTDIEAAPPVVETLMNIIPDNPIKALAEGEMLQIIFFALAFGIGIALLGDKVARVKEVVEQANEVMMKLVNMLMTVVPYAAFALMAKAVGEAGLEMIGSMGMYMITLLLALVIHASLIYSLFLKFWAKISPIKFFKTMFPAMEVAFTTSSSAAALPVTIEQVERGLKVPKGISSFVLPLGATINMDGTAIMQGVASIFIAQVYGIDLTFTQQLLIILTATLASIGTAAVPSAGIVMLTMVFPVVGLPLEGLGIVLGVDRLLDMSRTAINITGDAMVAACVARSEGEDAGDQAAPQSA